MVQKIFIKEQHNRVAFPIRHHHILALFLQGHTTIWQHHTRNRNNDSAFLDG